MEGLEHKKILILGAGQIGTAIARAFLRLQPESIILHALTEREAKSALECLDSERPADTSLHLSWGDIFVPYRLMQMPGGGKASSEAVDQQLYEYYYEGEAIERACQGAIYGLLRFWKPQIVIDAVNTATVLGSANDVYTEAKNFRESVLSSEASSLPAAATHLLIHSYVPKLIRFVQSLERGMLECGIEHYVKISTTGLGGMGTNIKFTHGDASSTHLSDAILGKIAASGMLHQLLWALSHTPGVDIRVIVPAALVGWNEARSGPFKSPLSDPTCPVDCPEPVPCLFGTQLSGVAEEMPGLVEMPVVGSGENSDYSLHEMATITALGQMGAITKEEVAEAVIKNLRGRQACDVLAVLDNATLGPTYAGAIMRERILRDLQALEQQTGIPSIATGNLGPRVAKHLYELYLLKLVSRGAISTILERDPVDIAQTCERLLLAEQNLRTAILSIGLPILFDDSRMLIGNRWMVPSAGEAPILTRHTLECWTERGWVDLRAQRVAFWQRTLRCILKDAERRQRDPGDFRTNAYALNETFPLGECLAYIYTSENGGRYEHAAFS